MTWKIKSKRFVSFFDIMGFKDIVERNSHSAVVKKLSLLKKTLSQIEAIQKDEAAMQKYNFSETKTITFSDSIVIFSRSDKVEDANKIIADSSFLLSTALKNGIAIKGALSYGEITVDFENSLFFGRPIIDSYQLHDQLHMYSVILDDKAERKLTSLKVSPNSKRYLHEYKTPLKGGKIYHMLISPGTGKQIEAAKGFVRKLKSTVSGYPRLYIDNTFDFLTEMSKSQ